MDRRGVDEEDGDDGVDEDDGDDEDIADRQLESWEMCSTSESSERARETSIFWGDSECSDCSNVACRSRGSVVVSDEGTVSDEVGVSSVSYAAVMCSLGSSDVHG